MIGSSNNWSKENNMMERLFFIDFERSCLRTMNSELTHDQQLCNWAMGLCGESGEYSELIKKHVFHGKPLDKAEALKELGDCLYYLTAACISLGSSIEEVAKFNMEKLQKRYPDGFVKGGGNR
jgi:NTP pyrophosphatase (non-canonical NTP hydrolase)